MFVPNNVRAFDWGEDPDLVQCILLLFLWKVGHFDFLESINLRVDNSLHFVDAGVGPFSELADDNEILEWHGIISEELIYFISFKAKNINSSALISSFDE